MLAGLPNIDRSHNFCVYDHTLKYSFPSKFQSTLQTMFSQPSSSMVDPQSQFPAGSNAVETEEVDDILEMVEQVVVATSVDSIEETAPPHSRSSHHDLSSSMAFLNGIDQLLLSSHEASGTTSLPAANAGPSKLQGGWTNNEMTASAHVPQAMAPTEQLKRLSDSFSYSLSSSLTDLARSSFPDVGREKGFPSLSRPRQRAAPATTFNSKLELVDEMLDQILEMEESELDKDPWAFDDNGGNATRDAPFESDSSWLLHSTNNISSNRGTCAPNTNVTCDYLASNWNSKDDEKIPFDASSRSSRSLQSCGATNNSCEKSEVNRASSTESCTSTDVMIQPESFMVNDRRRFRSYQCDVWNERLQELIAFKNKHGHCLVPHNWAENVALAQWVKRQRYQYKLLHCDDERRKPTSTMSEERMNILNSMGFSWDSHQVSWEEKYAQLVQYQRMHGHCNVSAAQSGKQYRPLSIWVKCQRRQRKMLERNEKSTMTLARMAKLDEIGFDWNPRNLQG